ncbi:MAG: polymerase, partial [Gaiellales bacterium]|nr:polymerase [Gaiellales bacterium]
PRVIAHLDLDAFFAAVEQLDRPELRGRPVVVGGDPRSRGVVSTASYEARAFGIRSAMSAAEAYRRCPKAIFVRPDMERYRRRSRTVWSVVGSIVERFEQVGIDEGYLDLEGLVREPSDARALLGAVQAAVRDVTGLSCALGCGTGKTVAKIASDHRKPGGIFVVGPGREAAFLAPLPLRALPGIGPRGEQRLLAAGLATIGDLARQDDAALAALSPGKVGRDLRERARGVDLRPVVIEASDPVTIGDLALLEEGELAALGMGKVGRDLRERARGLDRRPVAIESSDPVTIGEETTFGHDLLDPLAMAAELAPIAENVFARIERNGFVASTVTTKLRYDDFAIVTRSRTLASPVGSAGALSSLAVELLEKALTDRRAPVRLLGVYAGKLAREAQLELPLE